MATKVSAEVKASLLAAKKAQLQREREEWEKEKPVAFLSMLVRLAKFKVYLDEKFEDWNHSEKFEDVNCDPVVIQYNDDVFETTIETKEVYIPFYVSWSAINYRNFDRPSLELVNSYMGEFYNYFNVYDEKQRQIREAAERRARIRKEALESLTDEQKEALGLI